MFSFSDIVVEIFVLDISIGLVARSKSDFKCIRVCCKQVPGQMGQVGVDKGATRNTQTSIIIHQMGSQLEWRGLRLDKEQKKKNLIGAIINYYD